MQPMSITGTGELERAAVCVSERRVVTMRRSLAHQTLCFSYPNVGLCVHKLKCGSARIPPPGPLR